ncbi:hypothetical protein [Helicobacter pylori]|uniref:hypothetical protein n=1 Tax=Helicobacter pylori TaxID=210 RepID=UPI0009582F71|nr:putative uncharacterized protein [Helicobacter pylori]
MVSNTNDFGKVLDTVKDTFCNLLQLLTNLKNKKIEFYFHKKISNGLPFGIIFIASNSDNPIDIDNKTKKLESCFRDTIKHPFYCPFTIEDYLILDNLKSCFIFQKIELIGNDSDFREVLLRFVSDKNSPSISSYAFALLYEYFQKRVRDTFDRYLWHGYSKIPQEKRIAKIKEQMNEEIKINPSFCNYRVDSEQNRKINEIVEGLKSSKIIGKKIISNAFDLSVSYCCFITLDGLKNLKERLFIDIINVINQKKRVALNHAQIDGIQYNVLDSAFYFIFDVGNPSHLAIKVPRKSLENDELPDTKKNIFNGLIKTIYKCIDDENSFLELENDKTINDLNHQDLLGKLKTQAFPLSDIITNAINQKEGVALDYALINNIKYNLQIPCF